MDTKYLHTPDLFVHLEANIFDSFYKGLRIWAHRWQKIISLTLLRSRRLCKIIPVRIVLPLLVGGSYIRKTWWNEESVSALWIKATSSWYLKDIVTSIIHILFQKTSIFQLYQFWYMTTNIIVQTGSRQSWQRIYPGRSRGCR